MDELLLTSQTINKSVKPTEKIVFPPWHNKHIKRAVRQHSSCGWWCPARGTRAMCCVPRATCPALEATSHPSLCAVGCPGLIPLHKGRIQHIPVPRRQRGRRGIAVRVRRSGGCKGHRGRCSERAASPAQERSYLQSECAAISGRGFIEKSHLERGGSGAAAPGAAGPAAPGSAAFPGL